MKKLFLTLIVFIITLSPQAFARGFGMGIILGDPTGLSFKNFMGNNAVDGAIAYNSNELILYADYLKHFPGTFGKQNAFVSALTPYLGVGPVLAFDDNNDHHHGNDLIEDDDDDFALGVRIPFGVEWMATQVPVGVSLELVPGMTLISSTDAFFQGGIAIRYYFQ